MRLQLALNVSDLDEAVEFYSCLFGVEPARRRPGYANFAIDQPPLKLVLFETGHECNDDEGCNNGAGGTINHLGVEVDSVEEVLEAEQRISDSGLVTTGVDDTQCCFAEKTETWVTGPDGIGWEWYVRTGDSEVLDNVVIGTRR
jgi:catechol 2,3-dioxygenase-like lactoylglutathione lyase family enzyme